MGKMKFKDGVVLLHIHDAYLVVSDKEARKTTHYIREINDTAAMIWQLLEQGYNVEEITDHMMKEYDIEERSRLEEDLRIYIREMKENGYLIEVKNDDL